MKTFIYGVPGSGKTYFSTKFAKALGLLLLEADKFRDDAKKIYTKEDRPYLYTSTCKAYKVFGPLNYENVIKGLYAVRNEMGPLVIKKLEEQQDFIMEGAFLNPNDLIKFGKVQLLVCQDEPRHKRQFYSHREKLLNLTGDEFKAARIIQTYLIQEAVELGVEILNS